MTVVARFTPETLRRWLRREVEDAIQRRERALAPLVVEIEAALDGEPRGLSLADLCARLKRRRAHLLEALHFGPFEAVGSTKARRWRRELPESLRDRAWERIRRDAGLELDADAALRSRRARSAPSESEPCR